MKKFGFKVGELKRALEGIDDDTEIFIANSFNVCGNISELCEVRKDTYGFFGCILPCVILDSAQNVSFEEDKEEKRRVSRIYISGAITGTEDFMERFAKAEEMLKSQGHMVYNPAHANSFMPEGYTLLGR